ARKADENDAGKKQSPRQPVRTHDGRQSHRGAESVHDSASSSATRFLTLFSIAADDDFSQRKSPSAGRIPPRLSIAVKPGTRAILTGARRIATAGCDDPPAGPAKCGAGPGGIAGLPPPSAVWTRVSADSNFYTPRVADLDGDGRLEVVIAGGNEMPSFGEAIALDAETGAVRWYASVDAELYSSPVLLDVTGDGVKD